MHAGGYSNCSRLEEDASTGRIVSALPAVLLLSGVMKLTKAPAAVQGLVHFGYPENLILGGLCGGGRLNFFPRIVRPNTWIVRAKYRS